MKKNTIFIFISFFYFLCADNSWAAKSKNLANNVIAFGCDFRIQKKELARSIVHKTKVITLLALLDNFSFEDLNEGVMLKYKNIVFIKETTYSILISHLGKNRKITFYNNKENKNDFYLLENRGIYNLSVQGVISENSSADFHLLQSKKMLLNAIIKKLQLRLTNDKEYRKKIKFILARNPEFFLPKQILQPPSNEYFSGLLLLEQLREKVETTKFKTSVLQLDFIQALSTVILTWYVDVCQRPQDYLGLTGREESFDALNEKLNNLLQPSNKGYCLDKDIQKNSDSIAEHQYFQPMSIIKNKGNKYLNISEYFKRSFFISVIRGGFNISFKKTDEFNNFKLLIHPKQNIYDENFITFIKIAEIFVNHGLNVNLKNLFDYYLKSKSPEEMVRVSLADMIAYNVAEKEKYKIEPDFSEIIK